MFGERLRLARKKSGFSLRELSNALDGNVSAQSIGKYERGEMMPSFKILAQISKELNVSLEYLISERVNKLESIEFRKTSSVNKRQKAQVEAAVIEHLERYLAIEEILDINSSYWRKPNLSNRFIGEEDEAESLADELRKKWKLGIDPIPNMTSLLESGGIKVLILDLPEKVSGLTCLASESSRKKGIVPVIVVNRKMTLERRRFTLAHELGHRLIDRKSSVDHEKAMNVFAGTFLIPTDHLVCKVGQSRKAFAFKEIIRLKRVYRVSAAALLMRLEQTGIINKSTLAYAFQTYAKGWRSSEPCQLESEEKRGEYENPRRFERLCYWALAEKLIVPSKACELLRRTIEEVEYGMKGPGHRSY